MSNSIENISPTEFEKYCLDILKAYAEKENLTDFSIIHNKKIETYDSTYQIDVYAEFTAMNCKFKVLCECKKHKNPIERDIVVALNSKLASIGAQKGIIMSTSDFQSGAIQFAEKHGIALIQISDKDCLFHSFSNGKDESNMYIAKDEFVRKYYPPFIARIIKYMEITKEDLLYEVEQLLEQADVYKNELYNHITHINIEDYCYSKTDLYPTPKMIQEYHEKEHTDLIRTGEKTICPINPQQ